MSDWIEDSIERVQNVVYLAVAVILLRRKEREPSEGANSGHGADEVEKHTNGTDERAAATPVP